MKVDPLASLRCWAIGVELGGQEYTLPALPAAGWWPLLAEPSPAALLDMITDPDLSDRLLADEIETEEIEQALVELIEEVAGRPFMAAMVTIEVATQHWASVNGQLVRDGVRWDVLPLGAVLDAIHALLLERLGDGKNEKTQRLYRDEYLAALETPLPGQRNKKALSDFEALAGPRPTAVAAEQQPRSSAAPSEGTRSRIRTPSRPPRRPALSGAPTTPPATPERSDQPARSAPLPDEVAPASGTAPRPRLR